MYNSCIQLSSFPKARNALCISLCVGLFFHGIFIPSAHAIENSQTATSILGQTDADLSTPSPIYSKGTANDAAHKLGFNTPTFGLALDPTDHRLFISDTVNNRVLVYNLDADDALLDRIPDNVLGKSNFWSNNASATQASMYYPNGLAFDDTNDRLFVTQAYSTTVSRVTVYDVASITDGENAVNVLGQATFTAIAPATTQEGMNFPTDAAYDSVNQRLFVVQSTGNRVTVYDVSSITDGEAATYVLGQAAFTTTTAATTQTGMNVPYGLAYDSANQRLFVSESTGNRVKVYDVTAISDNENAAYVLGQSTFTGTAAANTQAGMNAPRGITYDSVDSLLYVAQATNNRVTTYDVASISNGENAVNVLGQTTFTATAAANTQAGMNAPSGVLIDAAHNRLYVGQTGSHRVTLYDVTSISDGENATDVLGQYDDNLSAPGSVFTKATANGGPTKLGLSAPNGVTVDPVNHRLFVADTTNNRVLVYNLTTGNLPVDMLPDNVLGQTNFYSNTAANTQTGLNVPNGLAFDGTNQRLFVSEGTGNRIKVYDVTSITNGEDAVSVLGQVNYITATAGVTQIGLSVPRQIVYDSASGGQLFVADSTNNRVVVYNVASIVDGETAVDVIGQDDGTVSAPSPIFTKGTANNAAHKLGFNAPNTGIALDPTDHRLFLSDSSNYRVLVYDLDTDNTLLDRVPDNVLGQTNFYTNSTARTQAKLNLPYGLAYDDANNRLFIVNGGSHRVTTYDVSSITNGEDAVNVLGQATFAAYSAATTQVGMNVPVDVVYDSTNTRLFVAENTGNRVKVYSLAPGIRNGMNSNDVLGQTDSSLSDPQPIYTKTTANNGPNKLGLSAPIIGMALDAGGDRLFLSDTSNNRILVYNLNPDDSLIDRIPDSVLGQTNFHSNAAGATQIGLETPNGLAMSGSSLLFVAEGAGSRVKIYDVAAITDGENAVHVLGQTTFAGTTAATTQGGMSAPSDVLYDSANRRLFVADPTLNRVTTYDLTTITNGENAVNVLGQALFTTSTAATTQTGMNVPYGLAFDSATQRLFVSEGTGNRVKVYDVTSISDNENADYVLGQSNFTDTAAANSQAGMNAPRGLAYDSTSTTLFVAEATGDRVKTYNVAAISNGENAVNVLGQANFTGAAPANTQAGLNNPTGVFVDSANRKLYAMQSGSHRVSVFDITEVADNENAVDLLGQYNGALSVPVPVYTKTVAHNGPSKLGLSAPIIGLALDPTDHRLFVSDTGNNRILVYNLDSNDLLVERLPDNVLGQTNFSSNTAANTQTGLNVPNGIAYDDVNNRLFVAEGTGNRVKVFDVTAISDGENAANVLGQAAFTTATAATTQAGMNVPQDVVYDSANSRLYVSQSTGNRVTTYDVTAISDGENAVNVLGQSTFTATAAATTQAGMNVPYGLALSGSTVLFVSQGTGNRVTTYDVTEISDGENAVNVLGQADFTATTAATTQTGMNAPRGITYDSTNKRLYVAQTTANRITTYDVAAISDGENAVGVFGQQNFTTATAAVTRDGFSAPTGVLIDPAHNRLYSLESTANRVKTFDLVNTLGIANGVDADYVLGQSNFTGGTAATTQAGMNAPRGLAYDSTNQILYVAQSTGNRVTTYDVSSVSNGENAVNVLGQSIFTSNTAATTQAGMNAPYGIAFDDTNNILYASQYTGNRVTTYDVASISDGENAVNVLGQPNFTTATAVTSQSRLNGPTGVFIDEANSLLYVPQTTSSRVSVFNVASTANGEDAVNVLGQFDNELNPPGPIYFKGTANNASYKLGLNAPNGVAVDATNHRLFVSDTTNNRILVYNLTTNNTLSDHLPDYVLGQTNYYWNAVSTTQNGLSAPTGLAFDASNNKLYAADLTNNRILIYDTANISDGENAVGVLGQPSFIVATAGVTQDGLSAPRQIHYDAASEQLYVADSTNNRVVIYGSPSSEQPAESTPVNSFYFYGF